MNDASRTQPIIECPFLQTEGTDGVDHLVRLAADVCKAPMAGLALVESGRVLWRSGVGMGGGESAFCLRALSQDAPLTIGNACEDAHFHDHPWVVGEPHVRAFIGAPLLALDGKPHGVLCIWDTHPRSFSESDIRAVAGLGRALTAHLDLLSHTAALESRLIRYGEDEALLQDQINWINNYGRDLEVRAARLEAINARLEALAKLDGMTGLKNHRAFQERLETEFQRAARYSMPLSLLLLDVDHFKSFNDSYGHLAGDEVLKALAQVLQESARGLDFVARYGGEEFVMILPHADHLGAIGIGERMRTGIEAAAWPNRPITASIGVATLTRGMERPSDLIAQADRALYASKANGRNLVTHAKNLVEE
ncbi:GGDEF domain-containing protein [Capsulimonas corticalis]|uniref:GGDEF domain-containing protein n=1 Tax=Capsulimonas corticalis TaxID=2219043 RepID=A0A402CVC8_9BACT|nr:sensor domain-containing diguanylate cyclase [Capsulimonas corticalis]BDI30350.1 GGDEF domain-containing protein [Capsulimonas corticalis]